MDMNALMRQAQTMQKQIQKKQREVEEKEFVVSSNGGAVVVTIMGTKKVTKIEIDDDLLEDKEMLQDMIAVAVNEAIKKVDTEMNNAVGSVTGGMGMPGMF